jgi:hypothetical protein
METADEPEELREARKLLIEFEWTQFLPEAIRYACIFPPGAEPAVYLLSDGRVVALGSTFGAVFDSFLAFQVETGEKELRRKARVIIDELIARDIVSAQWTVYWYSDEEQVDTALYTTADGEVRRSDPVNNSADCELEDRLWNISRSFGRTGDTGIYTLDVATRTVIRTGDAIFNYDEKYEANEKEEDDGEEHSWMELTELPPHQHWTITF